MKWWFKLWPWRAPKETEKALDERLQQIEDDDLRVADLARRAEKIMKENNLAPTIIKALRIQ